jgi:hypothetical protein
MRFAVEIVARGTDYPRLWRIYHSEEFNRAVASGTKLRERALRERVTLPDGRERRRVHVVPDLHVPASILRLLKGQVVAYDEITVFDPLSRRGSLAIESRAGETVRVTGEIAFVEEPGCVRVCFRGEARVHLFGVGSLVERFLVGEVKARYAVAQRILQCFVDEEGDPRAVRIAPRCCRNARSRVPPVSMPVPPPRGALR